MSHSVTSILSQIRSYQTQMGQPALNPLGETPRSNALPGTVLDAPQAQPASFTETLRGAIAGVNDAQQSPAPSPRPSKWATPAPTWPR